MLQTPATRARKILLCVRACVRACACVRVCCVRSHASVAPPFRGHQHLIGALPAAGRAPVVCIVGVRPNRLVAGQAGCAANRHVVQVLMPFGETNFIASVRHPAYTVDLLGTTEEDLNAISQPNKQCVTIDESHAGHRISCQTSVPPQQDRRRLLDGPKTWRQLNFCPEGCRICPEVQY